MAASRASRGGRRPFFSFLFSVRDHGMFFSAMHTVYSFVCSLFDYKHLSVDVCILGQDKAAVLS